MLDLYESIAERVPSAGCQCKRADKSDDRCLALVRLREARKEFQSPYLTSLPNKLDRVHGLVMQARDILCMCARREDLCKVLEEVDTSKDYLADAEKATFETERDRLRSRLCKGKAADREALWRWSVRVGRRRGNLWRRVNTRRTYLELTIVPVLVLLALLIVIGPAMVTVERLELAAVMIFGALGGLLSGINSGERLSGTDWRFHIKLILTTIRPLVGAAAAAVLWAAVHAGLIPITRGDDGHEVFAYVSFVLAFIAGFSERFFLSQVERLGASQAQDDGASTALRPARPDNT